MKKITLLLTLFVFAWSAYSFAQEEGKAKKEKFSWQKQYMDEAGIPAEIQLKIEGFQKETQAKVRELKNDSVLSDEQKMEKIKELRKKTNGEIMGLLSKEQKEKIKSIKERVKKESEVTE